MLAYGTSPDGGPDVTIAAEYLIGCDGGRSTIRKLMGANLAGDEVVQRVQSTYIRAPELKNLIAQKPAWMTISLNPRRCGTTVAIDGENNWLVHNHLAPTEGDFDSIDRDWSIRTILGVDDRFEYETISKEDWVGRRLVANRFRNGRVFICGDAAHLWIPYAGYGMNAGIADAVDLSWILAAVLHGWADVEMLNAYEVERQPITEQVSHFAMKIALALIDQKRAVPPEIESDGPLGDEVRERIGRAAYDLNVQQYCCAGLNFGYYYDRSPIIAYDGETPPPYTMGSFVASTVPGARVPHVWLKDGKSLLDELGAGYTLIRTDAHLDVRSLMDGAARRGIPLSLVDVDSNELLPGCEHRLLIVRPDSHIAWRGLDVPSEPDLLLDHLRGAASRQNANGRQGTEESAILL